MVNYPVILSGWIWVYQTLRRNQTPWTHPCSLIRISVVWLFTFICAQLCAIFRLKKLLDMCVIHVGGEVTCRELVVHFMLHYCSKTFLRKGFDPELYQSAKFT